LNLVDNADLMALLEDGNKRSAAAVPAKEVRRRCGQHRLPCLQRQYERVRRKEASRNPPNPRSQRMSQSKRRRWRHPCRSADSGCCRGGAFYFFKVKKNNRRPKAADLDDYDYAKMRTARTRTL
jgi:hypothetical protein